MCIVLLKTNILQQEKNGRKRLKKSLQFKISTMLIFYDQKFNLVSKFSKMNTFSREIKKSWLVWKENEILRVKET